ncbi:hypothetical protein CAP31_12515 [Sulfuriferula sp. AH1]|uniref:DUF4426 domain-containing protein n=1 Tax=Sulfuriferula sp. AH1 TaxID=1985873 RepID=UPI000B3B0D63|nr:DUF4426 domain-containing protein [Sulfuriferula sp. AH1]ARU32429.1 hypothetical protein CAP31_12515 [Sulfuriferula sp. AH1]
MKRLLIASLLLGLLPAAPVMAEQSQKFGAYEIHYNAMPTDELAAKVAKAYNMDRRKARGLVTISILKSSSLGGIGQPVKATLDVSVVNMSQQLSRVKMREIAEGTALYYIGEFRITPPDTLKFRVTVKPAGEKLESTVEFSQEFFK